MGWKSTVVHVLLLSWAENPARRTAVAFSLVGSEASPYDYERYSYSFFLHVDQAELLSTGTLRLPPMASVPCSVEPSPVQNFDFVREIVKPPNVDDLFEWYVEVRKDVDADPSWGVVWPTAISLTNHLLSRPQLVQGKRVIELGAGLGVGGLTCAALGARSVTLTDRDPFALHCAMASAASNQLSDVTQAAIVDWCDVPECLDEDGRSFSLRHTADVIIASDVLYDGDTIAAFSKACQDVLAQEGGTILLTDPKIERCRGARQKLVDCLQDCMGNVQVDVVELPLLDVGRQRPTTIDGKDHIERMKGRTVLVQCTVSNER